MIYLTVVKSPDNRFVQIDNRVLEDDRISYRAKGVLAYLLSRPPGWKVVMADLCHRSTEGETAIQSAVNELKGNGYLKTESIRGEDGRLKGKRWTVFEQSTTEEAVSPKRRFPQMGQSPTTNTHDTHTSYSYHKKHCGGRFSAPPSHQSSSTVNGFFKTEDRLDPYIKKVVLQLEDFIRKSRKLDGKRFKRSKWYNDIRLLLQDINNDRQRLTTVLDTFLLNKDAKFMPQVESAESFRHKFSRIEMLMFEKPQATPKPVKKEWTDEEWDALGPSHGDDDEFEDGEKERLARNAAEAKEARRK